MMTEKYCPGCDKTKLLSEFPTRGREKDRHGNPSYKSKCYVCENERKLAEYYKNKAKKEEVYDERDFKEQVVSQFPAYVPKSSIQGSHVSGDDDYSPWTERLGRELTDDEKFELDVCAKALIVAMMDLAVKEKENTNGL